MADLDNIAGIKDVYKKYIVRPAGLFGLAGFVFDIEGEANAQLQNNITDHYTEDNTTISDHITVLPKRITLKNYVGELADIVDDSFERDIQKVGQKLITLGAYVPSITDAAQQALPSIKQFINGDKGATDLNISDIANNVELDDIANVYSLVKNFAPPIPKQSQAFLYLKALRDQKILVSIQTPFEFMENMAIETIVARQGEETVSMSDFTVTFKEVRFATTQITQTSRQGRNAAQSSSSDGRGKISGQDSLLTDISQAFDGLFGG